MAPLPGHGLGAWKDSAKSWLPAMPLRTHWGAVGPPPPLGLLFSDSVAVEKATSVLDTGHSAHTEWGITHFVVWLKPLNHLL